MQKLPPIFQVSNPSVLITGGSSGIGKEITMAIAALGVQVYATTRNPQSQNPVENVSWLKLDGSSRLGCQQFIDENRERLVSIDLLVNNAGSGLFGEFEQLNPDAVAAQMDLMLITPIFLCRECLPHMRSRKSGGIVNVSSLASQLPLPYFTAYNSAKAGLSAFTRSLMLESADTNPFFIDFQPGDYKTSFNNNAQKSEATGRGTSRRLDTAWGALEKHLNAAPTPEKAVRDLLKALEKNKSQTVHSGDFFQTTVATVAARLIPHSWTQRIIGMYYQL